MAPTLMFHFPYSFITRLEFATNSNNYLYSIYSFAEILEGEVERKKKYLAVTLSDMKIYSATEVAELKLLGNPLIPTSPRLKKSHQDARPVSMAPVSALDFGIILAILIITSL